MTIQDAKDQVAKNNGWKDWSEVIDWHNREKLQNEIGEFVDEVSQVFGDSQYNQGIDDAIEELKEKDSSSSSNYISAKIVIEELKRLKR